VRNRSGALRWTGVVLILLWSLIPIYWALKSSLQTEADARATPVQYFPTSPTLQNYRTLLSGGGDVPDQIRRSAVNIVPGLIGVILTMTMVLFTAIAIVRERERGNMELLIATPLTSAELMIGKVLPYIAIGFIQTSVVLALGTWLFKVPILGSLLEVYLAAGLLIFANLALGLLISTRAQSQFQAMQMSFFVFLPSILLSGFMFPFAGMPHIVQYLAEVLPLTHFLRLIRGVMLRGGSLWELWPDVLALLAFTLVMMSLAILRFRKRLD
jgi:ABC-2 type transport system permease protein